MAVYKVLQDIEGEDHIIAWLTPRQTIYAAIVVISLGLGFVMGKIHFLLAVPWVIPVVFFGFLAAPLGRDQPNDVWLGAQIRFYLKNRKRIWDQSGMEELVHITAPKRVEKFYTDGLNQGEVRSRLRALSTTIDSRGWAVKNSRFNYSPPSQFGAQFAPQDDDRLLDGSSLEQDVPISDVTEADDILDADNNMIAQRFDQQIKQQEAQYLEKARQSMYVAKEQPTTEQPADVPEDFSFMQQRTEQAQVQAPTPLPQPQLATFEEQLVGPQTYSEPVDASPDPSAQALLDKIHHDQEIAQQIAQQSHEKVIRTPAEIEQERLANKQDQQYIRETTTAPQTTLHSLAQSDLKVSTLAAQARYATTPSSDDEVVVSLH